MGRLGALSFAAVVLSTVAHAGDDARIDLAGVTPPLRSPLSAHEAPEERDAIHGLEHGLRLSNTSDDAAGFKIHLGSLMTPIETNILGCEAGMQCTVVRSDLSSASTVRGIMGM